MWGPILVTVLIHLGGMPLKDIFVMEAVVLLGVLVLEVPSGALADLIGRKKTVVLGSMCNLLSGIQFAFVASPADVWVANILWAIGAALCSGADTALLFDSLKQLGREHEFQRIEGRAIGNRLFLIAIGSVAAGLLAEIDLRLPLLLSLPALFVGAVVTFFFQEPVRKVGYTAKAQARMVYVSVLFVANHAQVKWVIGFSVLMTVVLKISFFVYNPYFELVALPYTYFGLLFFCMNIIAWFVSTYGYRAEERVGVQVVAGVMVVCASLPAVLAGSFVMSGMIGVFLIQHVTRGLVKPFLGAMLNMHLDSKNRATVLSISSATSGLANFIGLLSVGYLVGVLPLALCLQVLGVVVLLAGLCLVALYPRVFR